MRYKALYGFSVYPQKNNVGFFEVKEILHLKDCSWSLVKTFTKAAPQGTAGFNVSSFYPNASHPLGEFSNF